MLLHQYCNSVMEFEEAVVADFSMSLNGYEHRKLVPADWLRRHQAKAMSREAQLGHAIRMLTSDASQIVCARVASEGRKILRAVSHMLTHIHTSLKV
jgi:hypothetical protein